jgi:S-adenosylmethionine hydrolase
MAPIITLITDFGTTEAYVASMKGVILTINPVAIIVDITHAVESQNILQAAFILSTTYHYFPESTIHVAIVDPGVGSRRKAIILKSSTALFVAPDNGILSYIIDEHGKMHGKAARQLVSNAEPRHLPHGLEAVAITNSEYWHHPVSSTFHGRDIFAPVAAHLSLGVELHKFGDKLSQVHAFPIPRPYKNARGDTVGRVLHVDHFGNLITNIKSSDLPANVTIYVGKHQIRGISSFYAHARSLAALIGSSGYLEISMKDGSAAALIKAAVGQEVILET